MTRKSALSSMVSAMTLATWLVVPARAQERERTVPTRAFDRFELESETAAGFWAEAGALYETQQDADTADGRTSGFHSTTAFGSGSVFHMSVADVRAHLGGEFFTGSSHDGAASDRLVYGFGIFLPLCKYAALRNEFSGVNVYDLHNGPKVVNYLPGLDIRLPIGNLDMLLRITGEVGVSSEAPPWGAGGSLVITSPTMRAPARGGVVIE
jgi:hypothetical protein